MASDTKLSRPSWVSLSIAPLILLSAVLSTPAHASARTDFKAGYAALVRHDYERAITYFTRAIEDGKLPPADLALAYHYRGAEYVKTGQDNAAIADFNRALAMTPGLATVYNDRAIAFRRKGDLMRAIADYSEAIRLHPQYHGYYLNRGLAYAANGEHEKAIADYEVSLFYKPNGVPTLVARGDSYMQQGRKNAALADYRQAMRKQGDFLEKYPHVKATLITLGEMPAPNVSASSAGPRA